MLKKDGFIKEVVLIAFLFICFIVIAYPYFHKKGEKVLNAQIRVATEELNMFLNENGVLEDKEYYKKLVAEKEHFDKKLVDIIEKVFVKEDKSILSSSGLVFKEKYYKIVQVLKQKAESKDIKFIDDFGFGEGLPEEDEVVWSIRRLDLINMLLSLLVEYDVAEVLDVKILDNIDVSLDDGQETFCTYIPISISFLCSTKELIAIWNSINNLDQLVFINNLDLKKEKDVLLVNIIVNKVFLA